MLLRHAMRWYVGRVGFAISGPRLVGCAGWQAYMCMHVEGPLRVLVGSRGVQPLGTAKPCQHSKEEAIGSNR